MHPTLSRARALPRYLRTIAHLVGAHAPTHRPIGVLAVTVMGLLASPAHGAGNLVKNPSFEDRTGFFHSDCPLLVGQWDAARHWSSPSAATPDFFHACAADKQCAYYCAGFPPNVAWGWQSPRSGSGYVGFSPYVASNVWYREYLQGELTQNLNAGTTYWIEFWVSLADDSHFATDGIGAVMQAYSLSIVGTGFLPMWTPDIVSYGVISEDDAWVRVGGAYTASGGEDSILIGCFPPEISMVPHTPDDPSTDQYAYYFVDDVLVCEPAAIPRFTVQPRVCFDEPIILNASASVGYDEALLEFYRTDAVGGDAVLGPYYIAGLDPSAGAVDLKSLASWAFDIPGVYRIKVAVGNDCTLYNELVKYVTVSPFGGGGTGAAFLAPTVGYYSGCDPIELTAVPTGGVPPYEFRWYSVDGAGSTTLLETDTSAGSDTFLATVSGDYQVLITDSSGCDGSTSDPINIEITGPHAQFTMDTLICAGDPAIFDGAGTRNAEHWIITAAEVPEIGAEPDPGAITPPVSFSGSGTASIATQIDLLDHISLQPGKIYKVTLNAYRAGCLFDTTSQYVTVWCCHDCYVAPPSSTGWWPFDSANFNGNASGITVGMVTGDPGTEPGLSGTAMTLDGVDDMLEVDDSPLIDVGSGDLSILARVRIDPGAPTTGNGFVPIVHKFALETSPGSQIWTLRAPFFEAEITNVRFRGYALSVNPATSQLALLLADGSSQPRRFVSPPFESFGNDWRVIAVTIDRNSPGGIAMYVDEARIDDETLDPTIVPGDLDNDVSMLVGSNGTFFTAGAIDDLAMFDRPLDQAEIGDFGTDAPCVLSAHLPSATAICSYSDDAVVPLTICNWSAQDVTVDVSFAGVPAVQAGTPIPAVDGPTEFVLLDPSPALIPAYGCTTVRVLMTHPPNLDLGKTARFVATIVTTQATTVLPQGLCAGATGSLIIDAQLVCAISTGPNLLQVAPRGDTPWGFEFINNSIETRTIPYDVSAVLDAGGGTNIAVGLDGMDPGQGVAGQLILGPGEQATIDGVATFDLHDPFNSYKVILSADATGDGIPEPVASTTLRSLRLGATAPPPPDCLGDFDGDMDTDVFDFGIISSNFGHSVTPFTNGDIDGSGFVDVFDFAMFAPDFGCGTS